MWFFDKMNLFQIVIFLVSGLAYNLYTTLAGEDASPATHSSGLFVSHTPPLPLDETSRPIFFVSARLPSFLIIRLK